MDKLEYIKGITFFPFAGKGAFQKKETYESLRVMKERTGANLVILVPTGLQDTAQSEDIDYQGEDNVGDEELTDLIHYAQSLELRVVLKPTVNCRNGTWRAHIHFFDQDVPCEPKWSCWFASYTSFQLHYARIAEQTGCYMFIPGCEMVMSEHRETEWRALIGQIRGVYSGLISYNTDKYQEDHVAWWDCVDVISSSGYYPAGDWESQLDRIEAVVRKNNRPFFFAETGCMSATGSSQVPNDWNLRGEPNADEQEMWYRMMFEAIKKRDWIHGCVLWSWSGHLYDRTEALCHPYYEIYLKPAEETVAEYFGNMHGSLNSKIKN